MEKQAGGIKSTGGIKLVKNNIKIYIAVLTCWLVFNANNLFSQDTKYRDIYPYIESRNFIEAVPRLKEFLKVEPDHPSANLQLAMIFEERFRSYHPILQYHPAVKNAENAKTYFLKSNILIDEKEIKKNGKKYYTNFAKVNKDGKLEVSFFDVKGRIDSAYIQIDKFLRFIPDIYDNFTNAVSHYDAASRNFAEINGKYDNLKDIYLLYDNDLSSKLKTLKTDYDSSILYLKKYLDLTNLYPILKYKQSYTTNEIENYRLDGLKTQTDFLAAEIPLWNYGAWVDSVNTMYNGEIKKIRNQLFLNEDRVKKNISLLSVPSQALQSPVTIKETDRDLIFKLRNFDHTSLVIPLLLYQDQKQSLLFRSLHEYELQQDSAKKETSVNLLTYYSQLFSISRDCDSLLNLVKGVNNDYNYNKHSDFIKKYFSDKTGFDEYLSKENNSINERKNGYTHQIRDIILSNQVYFNDTLSKATLKKQVIPLYIHSPDTASMKPEIFYTTQIIQVSDSTMLVAGSIKPKNGKGIIHVFLARISQLHEVKWLHILNSDKKDTVITQGNIGSISIVPEGIAMLVNYYNVTNHSSSSYLELINENGEHLGSLKLSLTSYPRMVVYSEADGSYLILAKGVFLSGDMETSEPMEWIKVNRQDSVLWKNEFSFSGKISSAISSRSGYIIFGDFTKITNLSGKLITSEGSTGETKAFALTINDKGNIADIKVFDADKPYYILKVHKINDENINLLGIKGPLNSANMTSENVKNASIVHFIINSDLRVLYSEF